MKRKPLGAATLKQVEKAQAGALEELGLEVAKGTDVSAAKRLLKKTEDAKAENKLGLALETARAAKRAVEIASKVSKVRARLSEVQLEVENAKAAGAETLALEKALKDTTKAINDGDLASAERILRRTDLRKQRTRLRSRAEVQLEKARRKVTYCRERGADAAEALEELNKAEKALRVGDYAEVRDRCLSAQERAEQARRYARAEAFLKTAMAEAGEAAKEGADVTVGRRRLHDAREALKNGVYADVQRLSREARQATREAKRHAVAEAILRRVEREVRREERRKSDVSAAQSILEEARKALADGEYARVRALAKDVAGAVRGAAALRRMAESLESLRLDVDDLRTIGADTSELETLLKEAEAAYEAKRPDEVQRIIVRARKAAESAREAKRREAVALAVEQIVEKVGAGRLDSKKVKELLRQVEDAALLGQALNIGKMVEEELQLPDQERVRHALVRLEGIRDLLVELRRTDIDIAGADELIKKAREALDQGRFEDAEALIQELENLTQGLKASLEASARDILDRSRKAVEETEGKGFSAPDARRFLESAEEAFKQGKIYESLEFARLAHVRARKALEAKEERLEAEAAATLRAREERTKENHRKLWSVQQRVDELAGADMDVTRVRESLASVVVALDSGDLEQAEIRLDTVERLVDALWGELRRTAEQSLDKAKISVARAKEEHVPLPALEETIAQGEQALNESGLGKVLLVATGIEQVVSAARAAQEQEKVSQLLERGRRTSRRLTRVKSLINQLRRASVDITDSDEVVQTAEMAIREKRYDEADTLLQDLERTATELRSQLVVAANTIISRAGERIASAEKNGLTTGEAEEILGTARSSLQNGEFDKAIEYAAIAERKADEVLKSWESQQTALRLKEQDLAKAEIANFKRVVSDLSRADIDITGASEALERAERAFGEGRFADVAKELAEAASLAQTLQEGLKDAAEDLLAKSKKTLEEAKSADLDVGRGERVVVNAEEALGSGRYVETIEYTKVISDIVETARRHKELGKLEDRLDSLRGDVERIQALGIEMSAPSEMLRQAREDVALGRFENLDETARKISEAVGAAQHIYIASKLKTMDDTIQESKNMGLETAAAESLYKQAEEAIQKKDLAAIDNFVKQVDVLLNSARRAAETDRIERDIRAFEDMLGQAARAGVETGDLRPIALQAREAARANDFAKAESLIAEGKSKVRERRRRQFADRYETRMQTISSMIDSAKQFGANVAEAERILVEASKALDRQDLNMADILVKQAEVSAGIQIQNFIKNRYPNLVVKMSEQGLQADVWNNFAVEVSNKGKLNAKNVQLKLEGDVDVSGLEPIAELGVNETKKLEFGVKPRASGQVPLNVEILYQRYFDENKYELKDLKTLKVEKPGTYLVEDVFLVHSDGRLITHQTRKFRETIDEDIFSGMLTVVQDFVKDSFRQRTRVGLKRLEFGESKILLERSEHAYLACVIVGDEPELLPLYMTEILREIEGRYGQVLEAWSGMMQELEGIEDFVAKLIFVTDESGAALGALEYSPVTETVRILRSSGMLEEDAVEVKKLLQEASNQVPLDPDVAWNAITKAREEASKAVERFGVRMKEVRDATHRYVDEMKQLGVDASQAELLIVEADEAYDVGKYEKLQDIFSKIKEGVDRAKESQIQKRIETELTGLIQSIQAAKAEGADTSMAESYLSRIQDALEEKNYRLVEEYFDRARETLEEGRKEALSKKCREELDRLTSMVVEAKRLGVGVEEAERLLMKAADALQHERTQELESLLEAARGSATQQIHDHLGERYPRLFITLPTGGLESGRWSRYVISVANRGNWPAKNIELKMFGNVDISGPRNIPFVSPNEKRSLEIGVKPTGVGTVPIDLQLFYQRPLDESRYEITESKEARVEPGGTYVVEDVILTHRDGRLIALESRTFREPLDEEKMAKMLKTVQTFIRDVFTDRGDVGLRRIGFEANDILIEQGPDVHLSTVIVGEEPKLLPLYMVELVRNIEDKYGEKLATWNGDVAELDGVQEMMRSIFYVTQVAGADIGPLNSSLVTTMARLGPRSRLRGEGETDFVTMARSTIENEDCVAAFAVLDQIKDAVTRPVEELTAEVKAAVLATKETIGLELTDEEVQTYVEALRQVLQAIQRAKQKAGIETYWPVKRVGVKPTSQLGLDAVTSFRKIIVNQSLAKELDIVAPSETWRGMNVQVQVDTEALNRSYKLWAKKIEILLKSQDPWKIKSGIDRGEYAVGIDGQKVSIDREFVWFEESLPESVVEEMYEGGAVFVDTELTSDILSEGYAKEIVRIIKDARRELNLVEEQGIQLQIMASRGLYNMLKTWREYISSQTNSTDLRFVEEAPTEGYIVEATLGEENLAVGVKAAEI